MPKPFSETCNPFSFTVYGYKEHNQLGESARHIEYVCNDAPKILETNEVSIIN